MLKLKYYIEKLLKDNDVFVSIGANDGVFVDEIFQFKLLNNKWKCFFIEPIKFNFEKLIENYRTHYPDNNFTYINKAINTYCGSGDLITVKKDDRYGLCSFFKPEDENTIKITVGCITIKKLIEDYDIIKNIDFLKIDAEGMDSEIVLQFFDLNIFPKIILFEHIGQNGKARSYNEVLKKINGNYTIIKDSIDIDYEKYNILLIKNEYV